MLLTWSCFEFKESPLDPTTPTGMILKLLKDQRRLKIFVTAEKFVGDIGGGTGVPGTNGIQRADFICNNDANKPDNNTYKAMIVDGTNRRACSTSNCIDPNENVDWVFKPNTDYYRPNGILYLFTTNSAGIVTTNIAESILAGSYYPYWTGLASDWTISPSAHCNNWTDYTTSNIGRVGSSNSKDSKWYSDISSPSCDSSNALLCVGQ
ncbi:MAG: DUF1554 domain-containing protein [Leptospiraceae bacterium]|nr:DUF1554 domain-containing protein [Leptospiraceae bacterium]